jgi:hypothetical protein
MVSRLGAARICIEARVQVCHTAWAARMGAGTCSPFPPVGKKNLAHTVSEFAATAWVPIAGEITHQAPLFTHFLYHILLAQPIHTVHLFYFFFILHKVSHRMVP